MLRIVYMEIGLAATVFAGILLMLTALTWFVALAGVTTRPMGRWSRAAWIAGLAVFPPLSLAFLTRAIVVNKRELTGTQG